MLTTVRPYQVLRSTVAQLATMLIRPLHRFNAITLLIVLILGTLMMPGVAQAATTEVLAGSGQGRLAFEPSTVTIQPGDTVKWTNKLKADSACNVVFDKVKFSSYPFAYDRLPDEVYQQELFNQLSHKKPMKASETVETIFNVPEGEYTYACSPHQSEGMVGKVIVAKG